MQANSHDSGRTSCLLQGTNQDAVRGLKRELSIQPPSSTHFLFRCWEPPDQDLDCPLRQPRILTYDRDRTIESSRVVLLIFGGNTVRDPNSLV
jgi:hypothetical protein